MKSKDSLVCKIQEALSACAQADKVEVYLRFFKTGKGEYGEGDQFIGVTVPDQRAIAKNFWKQISKNQLQELIKSPIHEHRLTALYMLIHKYEKSKTKDERKQWVDFYLSNSQYINNWDLVDSSCYKILGHYCFHHQQDELLIKLSASKNMWEQRIAVVGSLYHIRKNTLELPMQLVLKNLTHTHDLMHKANGWMLREVGKRDEKLLLNFLEKQYQKIPRTSLRYAIEKIEEPLRTSILKGNFKS